MSDDHRDFLERIGEAPTVNLSDDESKEPGRRMRARFEGRCVPEYVDGMYTGRHVWWPTVRGATVEERLDALERIVMEAVQRGAL